MPFGPHGDAEARYGNSQAHVNAELLRMRQPLGVRRPAAAHLDAETETDEDTDSKAEANEDAHAKANKDADRNADSRNGTADTIHTNRSALPPWLDSRAMLCARRHVDTDTNTYADRHAYADAHIHANRHAYAHAHIVETP